MCSAAYDKTHNTARIRFTPTEKWFGGVAASMLVAMTVATTGSALVVWRNQPLIERRLNELEAHAKATGGWSTDQFSRRLDRMDMLISALDARQDAADRTLERLTVLTEAAIKRLEHVEKP